MGLAVTHFYLYALRLIADQASVPCTPPLLFGRRPPQSNCPTYMSFAPIQGIKVELKYDQVGISTTVLKRLPPLVQSLPAILHKTYLNPISAYSKGSRGLSV